MLSSPFIGRVRLNPVESLADYLILTKIPARHRYGQTHYLKVSIRMKILMHKFTNENVFYIFIKGCYKRSRSRSLK